MTIEKLEELKKQYNIATTLKYNIDEAKKELNNLLKITDKDLKEGYFKALSGFVLDEQEWIVQKFLFQRVVNFAIEFRRNKIKKLEQEFEKL